MVKHQAALKGGFGGDSFADDDPLAELARIVGFEPVAQPQPSQKIEPAFNLEEELLREFETYRGPTSPIPEAVPEEPIAYAPPAPVIDEPEAVEPEVELESQAAMPWEVDEAGMAPAADASEPLSAETDLASELEWAIAEHASVAPEAEHGPVVAEAVPVEPELPLTPAPVSRLSLPIANFPARPQPREPEFFAEPAPAEPVVEKPAPQSLEDVFAAAFDWKPAEPVAAPLVEAPSVEGPVAEAVEAELEPEAGPAVASGDDPLADLDVFDIGFSDHRAAAPVEQEVARREPDFGLSFADAFAVDEEPTAVEPAALREAVDGQRDRAASVEEAFDPFADSDFELSLDDLELDLSDFSLGETAAAATVEPLPAPPAAAAPVVSASFAPVAAVSAAASAVAAPAVAARPAPFSAEPAAKASATVSSAPVFPTPASSPAAPAPSKPVAYTPEPLPFDASEIAEQDEPPVVITVLDVPEVPVPEPEQAPAYRTEYDIDLDSELATLFADTAVPEPAPRASAAAAPVAAAAAAPAKAAPDDFDAFERALEEDFRETLGQSQARPAVQPARVQLQEDFEPAVRSGGRRWLLAASVALIAVLAAGGGYYWLAGSGGVASGEPPVILADKDPIKMVPENPGGASVPNQDKAVYDRVEGATEDPQQKSLISGSEEPVDVVQKTLMPETLPLEGENDTLSAQTPVGETEDPRLLPGSELEQPAAASSEPDAVAITPRKVRTMIVRADGTLVAQEVEAPAEPAPASAAPMLASPSTADAVSEPVAVTPPAVQAPVETAAPAAEPVTPVAAETRAVAEVPAAPVQPAAEVAVSAPVPTTRPAQQPVDIVSTVTDQGNVRPAQPAPTQTAAATPEAPPAAAAAPAGGYYVQIASLPSEAEAQKSYQSLSSRYSGVIGGKGVDIKRADIEGKGTYYRVRIPAGTRADAISLCESYKAAGGSCLVAR